MIVSNKVAYVVDCGDGVARQLAARQRPVRLLVRDPTRAPDLPGAQVVAATYEDRPAAVAALSGARTLFMVSAGESADRVAVHRSLVDAAVEAGVGHVVYLSFIGAAPDSTFTLGRDHCGVQPMAAAAQLVEPVARTLQVRRLADKLAVQVQRLVRADHQAGLALRDVDGLHRRQHLGHLQRRRPLGQQPSLRRRLVGGGRHSLKGQPRARQHRPPCGAGGGEHQAHQEVTTVPVSPRRAEIRLITAAAVSSMPLWARRQLLLPVLPLTERLLVRTTGSALTGTIRWAMSPAS